MTEHLSEEGIRRLAVLEGEFKSMSQRLQLVEAGVSNFRTFQGQMSTHREEVHDFIVRHDERENAREEAEQLRQEEQDKKDTRRSKIHFSLLAGLITFVVGFALWLAQWVVSGHHFVVSTNRAPVSQDAGLTSGYISSLK